MDRKVVIDINKPVVYSGITIAFAALALTGLGMKDVEAVNFSPTEIVTKIAQRFNLKQEDVQTVFNQFRDERHAQMTTAISTKLDEAVKSGKITAAQKQLVLDKMKQEQDVRFVDRQQHRAEMEKWATDNNIPLDLLMRGRMGKGMGLGHGFGR